MANVTRPTSRKRISTDSQSLNHAFEPRAKRLRSWKLKHCTLMELPAEIRLKILKKLLWQRKPLKIMEEGSHEHKCPLMGSRTQGPREQPRHRQSTFQFSPEILRTCRTLHEEGLQVLYNNTVACELWYNTEAYHDDDIYVSSFLRPDWNINHAHLRLGNISQRFYTSSFLFNHIKRLDIVVHVTGDEGCSVTRQVVKSFVKGTRRLPQLLQLNIRLEIPLRPTSRRQWVTDPDWAYENGIISREDYRNQALGPFAIMRGLKSVTVTGTSDEIACELTALMTGNLTVVDLMMMYESLMDYVEKNCQYGHCMICRRLGGYLERAEYAADMEDEAAFRKARSTIFDLVADHQEQERTRACQHDPPLDTLSASPVAKLPEPEGTYEFDAEEQLEASKCTWWQEHMQLEWERRNEDTETDRQLRQAEEKQRPSLIRLREIVRWERDESPFRTG